MAGRVRREAIQARLQDARTILGCVTDQPVAVVGARIDAARVMTISFLPTFVPARLRTVGGDRLGLTIALDIKVRPETGNASIVSETVAYACRVVDTRDREILAYHWHPRGSSPVVHPHLHLTPHPLLGTTAYSHADGLSMERLHFPTGHVTLADVVRFLITELNVEPRRPDWADILAANDA